MIVEPMSSHELLPIHMLYTCPLSQFCSWTFIIISSKYINMSRVSLLIPEFPIQMPTNSNPLPAPSQSLETP
jgi:hypothetical protein